MLRGGLPLHGGATGRMTDINHFERSQSPLGRRPMTAPPLNRPKFDQLASNAVCQSRETAPLFDRLVGALLELQRHIEAERLSRFEIDHQLVFRRRLHRKVSRLLALENAIGLWRIVTESLPFSSA
jgi:hypothetical protein